jgi:hypothetical protein
VDSQDKSAVLILALIALVVIVLVSWIGFNNFYDKYSCVKYADNGAYCIERRIPEEINGQR